MGIVQAQSFNLRWRVTIALCLGASLVLIVPHAVMAQRAGQHPLAKKRGDIQRMLRRGTFEGNEQAEFDQYFSQYFMRLFSTKSPDARILPSTRHQLRLFLTYGRQGTVYNRLVKMSMDEMKKIAVDKNAHPANRVNAILVLGMLKQSEPNGKPLSSTFPLLQYVVTSDRFPDDMKIAAMVGLVDIAQAEGGIPANKRDEFAGQMLAILNQAEAPAGRSQGGHNWMRRCAGQILAEMGSPGPKNEVLAAFQKIIADPSAGNTLRCELAECVGKLKFPEGAQVDFATLSNLLGHQTVEICQRELDQITIQQPPSRRLVVYALASALNGLQGPTGRSGLVEAAAGSPDADFVGTMRTKIKDAYSLVSDDEEVPDGSLKEMVGDMIADLRSILQPKPEPEADAVAADSDKPAAEEPAEARAAADGAATRGG